MSRHPEQSLEDFGRTLYAQVRQEEAANAEQSKRSAKPVADGFADGIADITIDCAVEAVGSVFGSIVSACTD